MSILQAEHPWRESEPPVIVFQELFRIVASLHLKEFLQIYKLNVYCLQFSRQFRQLVNSECVASIWLSSCLHWRYIICVQVITEAEPMDREEDEPISLDEAHRCTEALGKFMEGHPEEFSSEFQLLFQRTLTSKISHMIIEGTTGPLQQCVTANTCQHQSERSWLVKWTQWILNISRTM